MPFLAKFPLQLTVVKDLAAKSHLFAGYRMLFKGKHFMELMSLSIKREEKMKEIVLIFIFATLLKVNSAGITGKKWTEEDEGIIRGKLQWIMKNSKTALDNFKKNFKKRKGTCDGKLECPYEKNKDYSPKLRKVSLKRLNRRTVAQSVTMH